MKNDRFADIAVTYRAEENRGLICPEPKPINKKTIKLEQNEENSFCAYKKMDSVEELRQRVAQEREKYARFLCDLAPVPEMIEKRIAITDFTFSLNRGEKENINIPHYGGPTGEQTAVYESEFTVPAFDNQRVVLTFKGVDYIAEVFVNGEFVGAHEGFFAPFEFDITDVVRENANTLKVIVKNKEKMQSGGDKIYAATGLGWDDSQSGWHHCPAGLGIYNDVYVEIREDAYLTDVFVRVNDNAEELWIECQNLCGENENVYFSASIYGQNFEHTEFEDISLYPSTKLAVGLNDTFTEALLSAQGRIGKGEPLKLGLGFSRFILPLSIKNKKLWNPDAPFLYKAIIKMFVNDKLVSVKSRQFGIRTFIQKLDSNPKGKFYLNGREIRLYGANTMGFEQQDVFKHDFQQLIDDILLAKIGNLNFWRITQRPVQEEIYDYCDRLGLMVQTDLPTFGCIRINQYCEVIRQGEEMEKLVRSHPCCILDSYINEPFPNAYNQPHMMLTRPELQMLFDSLDKVIHLNNPDRVIKHVDGDYDPPNNLLPDNHCYTMWYNGHGVDMGKLHKGYWLDVKPGWHYGCGEFGSEGLDNAEIMHKYYPKEWLKEPFDPANIICAQSAAFHKFFFEKPDSLENWILESQRYQAFATKIMTSAMRRNTDMNTFAIHLFIDAFPSGWMKAIMDCDRNPKPAYFSYMDCLSPVFCSLRSDRFTFFENEDVFIEAYLCNDTEDKIDELRYMVTMNDKIIYSATVNTEQSVSQGRITFKTPVVSARSKIKVYMAAISNNKIMHYTCEEYEVFPFETLNVPQMLSFEAYSAQRERYDELIQNGANVIITGLVHGEYSIADKLISVKNCGMSSVYSVSRDTGHECVKDLQANDLSYLYDSEKDMLSPLAYTTFQGNDITPVVLSTNKNSAGSWQNEFVCGEWSYGKGKIMICQIDLKHKDKNPCAVNFLNRLHYFVNKNND